MTNGEKYKTAQERAEAFQEFLDYMCNNQRCSGCKLRPCGLPYERAFAWLDLEAEEEKPETIEDIVAELRKEPLTEGGAKPWLHYLADRIESANNRMAKAVKESEVK